MKEEAYADFQIGGGSLERWGALLVRSSVGRGIRHAPMDSVRSPRKSGAGFSHAVAECDDVVELLAGELGQVPGATAANSDASLAHDPHRIGTQRLGVTAGGEGFNIGCQPLYQRLGGTQWEP